MKIAVSGMNAQIGQLEGVNLCKAGTSPAMRCSSMEPTLSQDFSGRVIAVVVTFNRKEMLIECLEGLLHQTCRIGRIVLVDNASTDGTPERLAEAGYLANNRIDYARLPVNGGGAGGFHEGMKRAYSAGYDWLWVMDDDVEPYPAALATMLSYSNLSGCIQGAEMYQDGERLAWEQWTYIESSGARTSSEQSFKNDYMSVGVGCFEGMLIRRDIVSKIGFPDKRFFIGGDDVAYGYLASKYTRILYTRRPCFIKKIKAPAPPDSALGRVRNRLRHHRSQRFYFLVIRNELLLYSYIHDAVQPIRFHSRIVARLMRLSLITILCERRFGNFCMLWKGAWRGLRPKSLDGKDCDVGQIPS